MTDHRPDPQTSSAASEPTPDGGPGTVPAPAASESAVVPAPSGIVVGVDGSAGSIHAVRWAARHAGRFGPVTPVVAWTYPWWVASAGMPAAPPPVRIEDIEERARGEARRALAEVDPALVADLVVYNGPAGQALVRVGREAALIVVGTRGRGAVADAVLGSVSSHVVRHAAVPVAVVPEGAPTDDAVRRVVVGVDGSANAVAALAWAMRTTPADASLEAVHAWTYQLATYPDAVDISVEVFEEEAGAVLDRSIAAAAESAAVADPGAVHPAVGRLEYGDPRHVLLNASTDADLLVLGARGHHGVAHLIVGSVTTSLVHRPDVVTVVVPAG